MWVPWMLWYHCLIVISPSIPSSLSLRVFDDGDSMWRKSVKDIVGDVLCVSQFTLLANTTKGNKPDFHRAMVCKIRLSYILSPNIFFQGSEQSKSMYESFLRRMGEMYSLDRIHGIQPHSCPQYRWYNDVLDGKFGAMMNVSLTNEGPVTFTLDSRKFEYVNPTPNPSRSQTPQTVVPALTSSK